MLKAIIFDCYGVLVGKGFKHTYAVAGGDPETDADFIEAMFVKANGGLMSQQQFRQAVAERIGISTDKLAEIIAQEETPNRRLFDYIRTELAPRFKLGIVSNASSGSLERKIPSESLELFDVRIVSAEVNMQKPEQSIYQLAADRLEVKCEDCLFVDDQERYLTPAKKLGMHTICYTDYETFQMQFDNLLAKGVS